MIFEKIELNNWRNHEKRVIEFIPGLNLLAGDNAVGKTNVLEAIYMLAITKSFRINSDAALVAKNKNWSKIKGKIKSSDKQGRELEIRLKLDNNQDLSKEIFYDGVRIKALEVLGKLRAVIFSPDEIEKFFTSPARRRRWMDLALCAVDSYYAYNLMVYKKVLHNRNKLLKKFGLSRNRTNEMDFWDGKWAETAEYIVKKRRLLISEVNGVLGMYFKQIFNDKDVLRVEYQQSYFGEDLPAGLKNLLSVGWERDLRYGATSNGPHREDAEVFINNVKLVEWGSRAQMRLSLLALKLAEASFLAKQTSDLPVLLLDDIFSELDEDKQGKVVEFVSQYQSIISATRAPEKWAGKIINLLNDKEV